LCCLVLSCLALPILAHLSLHFSQSSDSFLYDFDGLLTVLISRIIAEQNHFIDRCSSGKFFKMLKQIHNVLNLLSLEFEISFTNLI
jgi:hypothetical protein